MIACLLLIGLVLSLCAVCMAAENTQDILVNVRSSGYSETGAGWADSGLFSYDGTTKTRYTPTLGGTASWQTQIPAAGTYEVFFWRVASTYASQLHLDYTGGTEQVVNWNTTQPAGWFRLGEAAYAEGQIVTVAMSNPQGGMMHAAAVKFVKKEAEEQPAEKLLVSVSDAGYYEETAGTWSASSVQGSAGSGTRYSLSKEAAAVWKPFVTEPGKYQVRLYHPVHSSDVKNAVTITVTDSSDRELFREEQIWGENDQSRWIDLGTYDDIPAGTVTVQVVKTGTIENPNNPGNYDQALRAAEVELVKGGTQEPAEEHWTERAGRYYIDSEAGDDNADGKSAETAWKTLQNVNTSEFAPGSEILLKAGSAWLGQLAPKGSGTEEAPIVIDMYGEGEKPRVDGNGLENTGVVYLHNQEYWEIRNLDVTDSAQTPAVRYGILVELKQYNKAAHHIYITGCDVHDVVGKMDSPHNGVGIFLFAPDPTDTAWFEDVRIDGNTVKNVDRSGIIVRTQNLERYSTDVVIQNNYLESIGGDGIVPKLCDGALVQYNVCNGAASRPTQGNVNNAALWAWQCDHAVFQYNEVYNTGLVGGNKDGQAFDSDFNNRNCVFQYNYSHDNAGGFMLLIAPSGGSYNKGTIVRYNISQNDQKDIFEISGEVENAQIYNNTIYVDAGSNAKMLRINTYFGTSRSAAFRNNIFCSANERIFMEDTDNGRPLRGEGLIFDSNAIYGMTPPETADRAVDETVAGVRYTGTWQITVENSITADPGLKQPGTGGTGIDFRQAERLPGYRLKAGSACIGAGTAVPGAEFDFVGNPIGEHPDIGACAFQAPAQEPDLPSEPTVPGWLIAAIHSARQNPFTDVTVRDWYYDAVQDVWQRKLMNGVDRTHFAPDAPVTRAMFVTILHRAAGKPDTAQPSDFRDVPETSYYAQAIAWAAENEIVTGTSNDSFSPDDLLTREQLVTILYRYLLHTGRIMPVTPELSGWSDADATSTFAREAMTWATSAGIVNGSGDQTLYPKQAASRAQVAALMMRLYQAIRK